MLPLAMTPLPLPLPLPLKPPPESRGCVGIELEAANEDFPPCVCATINDGIKHRAGTLYDQYYSEVVRLGKEKVVEGRGKNDRQRGTRGKSTDALCDTRRQMGWGA